MMTTIERRVFAHRDELASAAAHTTAQILNDTIAAGRRPVVSLTGGSVGVRTAAELANHLIPWDQVIVYFGDERFVPVKHDDRNDRQIDEVLFDRLDSHPTINRWPAPTELAQDVDEAAASFAERADFPSGDSPLFDVHLLGMGDEGHINSIFPHTPAVKETQRLVMGVRDCPKPPPERMTLTLPAIRRSRHVFLVVAGEEKAQAVADALGGVDPLEVPAAGAIGLDSTCWFLDEAAASLLR